MSKVPFFAHRPPSSGIHLLSDPYPERPVASTQDKNLTVSERTGTQGRNRKSGRRT